MGRRSGALQLFQRPGSNVWWCRFSVAGKQYRVSTGHVDRGEAEQAAAKLQAQTVLEVRPAPKRVPRVDGHDLTVLFGEFIAWETGLGKSKNYMLQQEVHFRAHIRQRFEKLYQFTGKAIERYAADRQQEKASSVTIYSEQVTISRFLKWCRSKGFISEVPTWERVRPVSDYEPPNLSPDDVKRILGELPDRRHHSKRMPVREFYVVVWSMALRKTECMTLRWRDVDLVSGTMTIRQSVDKGRRGRVLPLAKEAREVLADLAKKPHEADDRIFNVRDLKESLWQASQRCALGWVAPHHLRHARLSELASSTHDTAAVQYFAGHASLTTTDRYVRSSTTRAANVLKAVEQRDKLGPEVRD